LDPEATTEESPHGPRDHYKEDSSMGQEITTEKVPPGPRVHHRYESFCIEEPSLRKFFLYPVEKRRFYL
jgi:hypothetical protein